MLYGIKDASNLTIISNKTGKPVLYADYCNKTDISFNSETVYAMKKGVKAIGWDKNREGTMTTEMQVYDLKWIGLLMGSEFVSGSTPVNKREVLTVAKKTDGSADVLSAELSAVPKEGSLSIFKLDADGITHLDEQTRAENADAENTYTITGTSITLNNTTFSENDRLVAYYLVESASDTAQTFTVTASDFPGGYTIIGDTTIRDNNNVDTMVQFRMNNCKPKSSMSLSMNADDVTTLSIEWDIFVDSNNEMFTFKTL